MAAPKETTWSRGEHTEGKHLVLRKYLDAWLPILGSRNERIVFIDGFAGPGRYAGGEDGSPVVAIRALIEHSHKRVIRGEVVFVFIEREEDRFHHLERVVEELRPEMPESASAHVIHGEFDESMTEVLEALDEQRKNLAPTLVMIDPFGVKGTPMRVIERILANPRCEVYVSFMTESINRFVGSPEFEPHLDELFGTGKWREALSLGGDERRTFLYDLYTAQLRAAGAEHVVKFDLCQGKRLVYTIFFGTRHARGCDVMKQAIWKVAPFGDYTFRGSTTDQLILGVDEPNYEPLRRALCAEFGSAGWSTIEEVQAFVASDRTEYHTGQLKTPVLKPMEKDGLLVADEDSRNRRFTYPDGTRVRFDC